MTASERGKSFDSPCEERGWAARLARGGARAKRAAGKRPHTRPAAGSAEQGAGTAWPGWQGGWHPCAAPLRPTSQPQARRYSRPSREAQHGSADAAPAPHAARACRCCSASALWCMSTHREARKKRRMKWSGRGSSATAPMSPHTDCSACGTAARARAGGMREATRCGVEATGRCPRGARQGAMARCARAGSQHGCVQWHGQRSGKSGQQAGRRVPAGAACGGQRGHAPARRPSCRGTLQQMPPAYAAPRPSSPCGDEEE